jgi:hypothetical protein
MIPVSSSYPIASRLNHAAIHGRQNHIHPTRKFPVDPANEAGFDNSGESLTMSPALLKINPLR